VQQWRSSVAWGDLGKPVFRLTASSQLAESLAQGGWIQVKAEGGREKEAMKLCKALRPL
jgi:hypothetical protein